MKTIKFIGMVVLSAAIAFAIAFAIADTLKQFAVIAIFGGMFITLVMGVYNEREKTRYESIKHKYGISKKAA